MSKVSTTSHRSPKLTILGIHQIIKSLYGLQGFCSFGISLSVTVFHYTDLPRSRSANIMYLSYRHQCFTGKYATRKIRTKLYPGLEWHALTSEDIYDFSDIKFVLYTRFQCYVHRRHLRSSFDMPSFDMLFKRLFNCETGNFSYY